MTLLVAGTWFLFGPASLLSARKMQLAANLGAGVFHKLFAALVELLAFRENILTSFGQALAAILDDPRHLSASFAPRPSAKQPGCPCANSRTTDEPE